MLGWQTEATMLRTRLSTLQFFAGEERIVRRNTISPVGFRRSLRWRFFLPASFNLWAQTTGTILGEITDQSGAVTVSRSASHKWRHGS
jgi:hypothetical protein